MFNKVDYQNLANIVSRATATGVQEASILLVLYTKLQQLAQPDEATTPAETPRKVGRPKKEVKTDGGDGTTGS